MPVRNSTLQIQPVCLSEGVHYSQLPALILGLFHIKAFCHVGVGSSMLSEPVGHLVYLTCKDSQLR